MISIKSHILITTIISAWLILFLILIAPFDVSDLSFVNRFILMPFYGVISSIAYFLMLGIEKLIFRHSNEWTVTRESVFVSGFSLICLLLSFIYYQSPVLNGDFGFWGFTLEIYYPIFFLLIFMLIGLRYYFRKRELKGNNYFYLKGEGKNDFLRIKFDQLIAVSSSDNYVNVIFESNGATEKKLLRSTLKHVEKSYPGLLKIHRSHLVNKEKIQSITGANELQVGSISLPFSKSYKEDIQVWINSPQIDGI